MFSIARLVLVSFVSLATTAGVAAESKGLPRGLRTTLKSMSNVQKNPSTQKESQSTTADCVNLSGHWKGVCTDSDGDTFEDEVVVIEQDDCRSISMLDVFYEIGGSIQHTGSTKTNSYYVTAFPRWTANRSILHIQGTLSMGALDQNFVGIGKWWADYSLLEGKLITKDFIEFEYTTDAGSTRSKSQEECVYDRVR